MKNFINKLLIFEKAWLEDKKRKSSLLNFINSVLIIFFLTMIIVKYISQKFFYLSTNNENSTLLFFIFLILILMIFLIKKGFIRLISFSIIILLLISSLKSSLTWGIEVHTANIIYPSIILMSSILIGSYFSFFVFLFIFLSFCLICFLQNCGLIFSNSNGLTSLPNFLNLIIIFLVYLLIAVLSWISSSELEKSLKKTKQLANKLKLHNENLEILVEKRTKELKKLQLNQLTKIAPLLDLGKLSAGLIHDIRESLAVLSVILQNAQLNKNIVSNLDQAFLAIDKIDDLSKMSACKLFNKTEDEVFNLNHEINKLISLFEYKSKTAGIQIIFKPNKEFELHSDRTKLNQVMANLILNAFESYDGLDRKEKYIFIKLIKKPRNLFISIKDYGSGINIENLPHIFEPSFSSKDNKRSLGFGLYVSQETMSNIYFSKIRVETKVSHGSTFSLLIKNKFILNEFKIKK